MSLWGPYLFKSPPCQRICTTNSQLTSQQTEKGERCKVVPLVTRLRQGVHFHNFVVLGLLARTFRQENERKSFQTGKEGAKLSGENMIIQLHKILQTLLPQTIRINEFRISQSIKPGYKCQQYFCMTITDCLNKTLNKQSFLQQLKKIINYLGRCQFHPNSYLNVILLSLFT